MPSWWLEVWGAAAFLREAVKLALGVLSGRWRSGGLWHWGGVDPGSWRRWGRWGRRGCWWYGWGGFEHGQFGVEGFDLAAEDFLEAGLGGARPVDVVLKPLKPEERLIDSFLKLCD